MDRIDIIINESIDRVLTEDFFGESHKNDVAHLIKHYLRRKKNKKKKKLRKKSNGRSEYYDYDDYKEANKELSKGDTSSVIKSIDTEKTNIAAIARELFPDHTDEGAQSQLRKILNGERPLTSKMARKLKKMIAMGKVAIK